MEFDALIEISREATLEASKALSKLVHVPVSVGTVRVDVKRNIALLLDEETATRVCVISGPIVGDAAGLAALWLPEATACGLCDLLFDRKPGCTQTVSPDGEDALLELGNTVIGNYLRCFTRALPGLTLVHGRAQMLCDAPQSLSCRLKDAWQPANPHDALLFEVTFNFRQAALGGSVMIVLEAECIRTLLERAVTA